MKLFVRDRLFLPRLLPDSKSFLEFNLKRSVIEKVKITETDKNKYEIVQDEASGTIRWNPKIDSEEPKEVDFSFDELALIKRGIESIDGQPLPDELWQTAEKIWEAANQ